ncbi:peptidoglycan glycosyltransferase FtsW [Brachybacterium phenoliresistens]|uniref:Probable peptidoglycan glycosyltransferase FtsW n=1 Tax=Brachybacterium phenoliresistens TaxID=396014 RepID=Z9JTY6_9MICO|nr:putative peptidoglycan glycosyltransferase FtsW [Brachybacterium phenoliresistens]EWS81256.1 cell division protein FtsW [Brachybacterium phenoliresistens]
MTTQETRKRSTAVVRPDEERPLGDIGARVRAGVAAWTRSPALDFYALIAIGTILVCLGLVMVLSSSAVINIAKGESGYAGLFRQGRFALIGLAGLLVAAILPPSWYKRLAWPALMLGVLLQLLVFSPLGWEVYGNRNWIVVGGQTLQPSEMLKLALAVWLGALLAVKRPLLSRPFHLIVPLVPVVMLSLGLVVLGHDLGTMLVMAMLVAGSMWVAGVPRRWFALVAGVGTIGVIALTVTSANRMRRISSWLHGTCEGATCDQSNIGLQALAEGGWWGKGLGQSAQKWGRLPAAQDDFIFAIIGEELGLIGTLSVVAVFALLALVLFRMITRIDDAFVQITIGGISAWLLGQALVNMMVVTGLLPVLGVPLPFISSGGSALVASMMALGILLSFARHEPGAKEAISARIGSVRTSLTVMPASQSERSARPRRPSALSRLLARLPGRGRSGSPAGAAAHRTRAGRSATPRPTKSTSRSAGSAAAPRSSRRTSRRSGGRR